jgi:hypothetical protein
LLRQDTDYGLTDPHHSHHPILLHGP